MDRDCSRDRRTSNLARISSKTNALIVRTVINHVNVTLGNLVGTGVTLEHIQAIGTPIRRQTGG
ncbi:hypothetical protein Pmi06nite_80750 [Planotetraspora mira]|uniref:Uncharacterized protein n=1 Tax=Planotetraspora mira TaxID=58121 RepID=A0A8J3TXV2_9ACTN|nr:hypothetical protein Pmi06nite_80750 [Planotetraspora mira]